MNEHGDMKEIFEVIYNCKIKLGENGSQLNNIIIELCKKFRDIPENIRNTVNIYLKFVTFQISQFLFLFSMKNVY